MADLRSALKISNERIEEINAVLTDPHNPTINALLKVIERFGGPEEINRKAAEASRLENLMAGLEKAGSPYVKDLQWLIEQRDRNLHFHGGLYQQDQCGADGAESET